jgi:hypothetical protein
MKQSFLAFRMKTFFFFFRTEGDIPKLVRKYFRDAFEFITIYCGYSRMLFALLCDIPRGDNMDQRSYVRKKKTLKQGGKQDREIPKKMI